MNLIKVWFSLTIFILGIFFAVPLALKILRVAIVSRDDPGSPQAENATAEAMEEAISYSFPTWLAFLLDPVGVALLCLLAGLVAAAVVFARRG